MMKVTISEMEVALLCYIDIDLLLREIRFLKGQLKTSVKLN